MLAPRRRAASAATALEQAAASARRRAAHRASGRSPSSTCARSSVDAGAGVSYTDHFWEPFIAWLPELPDRLWFAMLWTGAAAAVLMTIGLWTRVASATTFAVVAFNLLLSQTHFHHNRVFLAILLGGVALLPAGRVLSVDAVAAPAARPAAAPRRRAAVAAVAAPGPGHPGLPRLRGEQAGRSRLVRRPRDVGPDGAPPARPRPDAVARRGRIDLLTSRWLFFVLGPAPSSPSSSSGSVCGSLAPASPRSGSPIVFHVAIEVSALVQVFSYAAIAALAIWVTPSTRDRVVVLGGDPSTARTVAHARAGRRLVRPLPHRHHRHRRDRPSPSSTVTARCTTAGPRRASCSAASR